MQTVNRLRQTNRLVQERLLPRRLPKLDGWEITVHFDAGEELGGNYHDFFSLADGRMLMLAADAGAAGGMPMVLAATMRAIMHACPLTSGEDQIPFCPLQDAVVQSPHIILARLNRVLVDIALEGQTMTAFCGTLSPAEGTLHWSNAGHPAPYWWRSAEQRLERLRDAVGLPLGLGHDSVYHHKRIVLKPGDLLVCPSAGVFAREKPMDDALVADRLAAVLCNSAPNGADAVKEAILAGLHDGPTARHPQDDLTLVVLERRC